MTNATKSARVAVLLIELGHKVSREDAERAADALARIDDGDEPTLVEPVDTILELAWSDARDTVRPAYAEACDQ